MPRTFKSVRFLLRGGLACALLLVVATQGCDELGLSDDDDDDAGPVVRVTMVPSQEPLAPGETVDISFQVVTDLSVSSLPFKLRTDPGVLEFDRDQAFAGDFFAGAGNVVFLAQEDPDVPGEIRVGVALLGGGASTGQGELCSLRFTVLPQAPTGPTTLSPFEARAFAPGLVELPLVLREIALQVR